MSAVLASADRGPVLIESCLARLSSSRTRSPSRFSRARTRSPRSPSPPSQLEPLFDRCPDTTEDCGELAARVYAPEDYRPSQRYPLIVLLHGYSASGPAQNLYLGLSRLVTQEQFVLVIPNGTIDAMGNRFWNATNACCDSERTGRDDVGYLLALLDEAAANYRIDPARVYLFGHSNGGFMSFRMACEAPERITAIASLAGATYQDAADCEAAEPVSVLGIHGTADEVIYFGGDPSTADPPGVTSWGYPSAQVSVERFAERAGCDLSAAEEGAPLDIDTSLDGAETSVVRYRAGCVRGVDAERWTIEEGSHLPPVANPGFSREVVRWLLRHER